MITHYFENGYYIPFISYIIYKYTSDLFLSLIVMLKLFPTNYYFHFSSKYRYLDGNYNMLKQFVRFTDTGYLISFLLYFFPNLIGLAFNVHFIITFAYWIGIFLFSFKDNDDIDITILNKSFLNFWVILNHSLPLVLIIYKLVSNDYSYNMFNMFNLLISYLWIYSWFIFIYLPWRLITNDPVYSILSNEEKIQNKIIFIFIVKILFIFSNFVGFNIFNSFNDFD